METNTAQVQIRTLTAAKGKWITTKNQNPDMGKVFAKIIYLGANDSPENYEEVTDKQKTDYEEQIKNKFLQQQEKEKQEREKYEQSLNNTQQPNTTQQ